MAMTEAATLRVGRGDRTRAALVDSALELFGRKGVEQTSIDEITAGVRVAKGTFYVHFQRKQDVLLELAAQLVEAIDLAGLPPGAAAALRTLGDRLAASLAGMPRAMAGRMVREIVGNREHWLRVLDDRRTLGAVLQPFVEQGQATGEIRSDQSAARLSQALVILWLDSVIGWAERPVDRPLARDLEKATSLFLSGACGPCPPTA
jgi:AcrR family transcriptional regulator